MQYVYQKEERMDINLFFQGYDSVNGYQQSILQDIDDCIHFRRCVVTSRDNDGKDRYDPGKYVKVDYDMCANARYEYCMDMNSLLPLDREVLTAMEPYEPTAVKMLCRITDFDIFTYDEAKRFYLHHLRYWNDIFERNHINFVFLTGIPHHTHDYIIYALTKVKKIPMCILAPTHLPHWCFVGNDLYRLYERLDAAYEKRKKSEEDVILPEDVEDYYQALLRENKQQKMQVMLGSGSKKEHARKEKRQIMGYVMRDKIIKRQLSRVKHGLAGAVKSRSLSFWKESRLWMKKDTYCIQKVRHKLKNCMTIEDYEKMAVMPDMTHEKYVLFLLHLQPEATTLPQAGVFVEQELCVQLLASVLKEYNIRLYVKEHFVQPYRMKHFYEDLRGTENVTLVSSDAESVDLLAHCVAASTPAGTVSIEAIANGKPVFVFGHGGFEHGPGIYQVGNEKQCREAIEHILKDGHVPTQSVRNYFRAFVESGICIYSPIEGADPEKVEQSRRSVVELAVEEIRRAYTEKFLRKQDKKTRERCNT